MVVLGLFAAVFVGAGGFLLFRAVQWFRRGEIDITFRGSVAATRSAQPILFWLQVVAIAVFGGFFGCVGLFLLLIAIVGLGPTTVG